MKRINLIRALTVVLGLVAVPSWALGFCNPPNIYLTPPTPPSSFSKPQEPFCLANYKHTKTHTCSDREVKSYINKVKKYIRSLDNYADEAASVANAAKKYANQASKYAACEARGLDTNIR